MKSLNFKTNFRLLGILATLTTFRDNNESGPFGPRPIFFFLKLDPNLYKTHWSRKMGPKPEHRPWV